MIEFILIVLGSILGIFLVTVFFGAPYVPTLPAMTRELYDELLNITPDDVVVDLGCGDGTVLLGAAQRGARVVGYEINPFLAAIAWVRLRRYRGTVRLANMWRLKALPTGVSVVYYFGAKRDIPKLQTCLQRWGGDYRLVSFGFELDGTAPIARRKALHLYNITHSS